jgi:hypothetical protein
MYFKYIGEEILIKKHVFITFERSIADRVNKKCTNKKYMGYLLFYIITVHPCVWALSAISRLHYHNIHGRQPHFYI